MIISWKQNLKHLSVREYKLLRELCHLSKNIYNESIYNIRQHYFAEGSFLKYEANYHVMKTSENYKRLGVQLAQQTMRCADASFRSFFKLLQLVKDKKFSSAAVNIPHYLDKNGFYALHIPEVRILDNYFCVPTSVNLRHEYGFQMRIRIPDKLKDKKIRQAHIIPHHNGKYFEVRYMFDSEEIDKPQLDKNKFLGIDLGVNNLATCVTNSGESFILDGKRLKSLNQWYNKETARLSSIKDKQHIKYRTNLQYRITRKRNNQVKDYIYCASKYIINYCLDNKISNIVIGYNEGFQQNSDIGKRNNQNFTFIPFGQLKFRIQFLADRLGINVILQEESYTSQASFFDNDNVPTYNPRNPVKYAFSGRRVNRGLYTTANGTKVNADINGALNILKKCNLTDLSILQARGKVVIPSRIRL